MNRMLCTVYRSSKEGELYLYMEKNSSLEDLPGALLKRMGKAEIAMTLLITPEKKLARANAGLVIEAIKEKGYFLQLPPTFTPNVVSYGEQI